ncbi:MAG: electron transport complex subunit RsxE [Planctomycetes bacterium]|nr:electron transport complex subunit RsxE [Planctomycetota bacterium]
MSVLKRMLWEENPVFVQILGICSALAVTNLVKNTMVMGVGLIFTTALSSFTVSALRSYTPRRVRMMVQILVIAAYVIMVKIFLDAFMPDISKQLGAYVGLIITNCIVMGRAEGFAASNTPGKSFIDGLGAGIGYTMVLLIIACVREPLGLGTFFGFRIEAIEEWTRWNVMVIAPGGFFMLAIFIWVARYVNEEIDRRARAGNNCDHHEPKKK